MKEEIATGEDARIGDKFLINITDQIFTHARDAIEETLEASDDLPQTIGQVSAEIMKSQLDAMKAVGKQMSQDLMLDAGANIVENLIEFAANMGLVNPQSEEEVLMLQSEAMNTATMTFAQLAPEYIDQAQVEKLAVDAASGKYDHLGQAEMQPEQPVVG